MLSNVGGLLFLDCRLVLVPHSSRAFDRSGRSGPYAPAPPAQVQQRADKGECKVHRSASNIGMPDMVEKLNCYIYIYEYLHIY